MKRFTTDSPEGNVQTARNLFYIKDKETWVRGGGPEPDYADITLYDLMRRIISTHKLDIDTSSDEWLGENLYERMFDGVDTLEGVVALLNTTAWAFSELREKLKAYEDTGLTPEEIMDGKLLTGWIPVEERLPKEWQNENGEPIEFNVMLPNAKEVTTLCFNGSQWFEFDWSNMRISGYFTITHWMPLPQPPKED